MQPASDEYIESMKRPFRNRGYIRGTIGIINSEAQRNAKIDDKGNSLTYFSNKIKPFSDYSVTQVYATAEEDFSKVDGSMYFLPKQNAGFTYYNNGIVTNALLGTVKITFDILGLIFEDLRLISGSIIRPYSRLRMNRSNTVIRMINRNL